MPADPRGTLKVQQLLCVVGIAKEVSLRRLTSVHSVRQKILAGKLAPLHNCVTSSGPCSCGCVTSALSARLILRGLYRGYGVRVRAKPSCCNLASKQLYQRVYTERVASGPKPGLPTGVPRYL
jgi:hypothetical protein